MTRRSFLQWSFGLGAALAAPLSAWASASRAGRVQRDQAMDLQWVERTLQGMGTTLRLRAAHASRAHAVVALDAAMDDIRALEDRLSLFRPDGLMQQLNHQGVLRNPPADVLEVLRTAQAISQRSRGAFDVTVQPLWQVFEAARLQGRLPRPHEVEAAKAHVDWRRLRLVDGYVELQPGMGVTLNGIAQGYVADRVRQRLRSLGIAHALVDTGEWAPLGRSATGEDWILGLANPVQQGALLRRFALQSWCAATSADDQCAFSVDRLHHHIFDPRTGYSPPGIASVTVLASQCVVADALTKVIFTAGFDHAIAQAQRWGVQAIVVSKQGQVRHTQGVVLQAA